MVTSPTKHTCVFGLGWGDEGKGKVVDLLCPGFQAVVRFNGGANAGHTVWVGGDRFAMHLLPSGVLHPGVMGVIGPGVVVDPSTLIGEIEGLLARGIDVRNRLKISERAHLVLTYHKIEDQLSERHAETGVRLGTTSRGIGPCYADKMRRGTAVRFTDLLHEPNLHDRVAGLAEERRRMLRSLYGEEGEWSTEAVIAELATAREKLQTFVCDTTDYLTALLDQGAAILFEGANGVLLDIDHGTYPFVTSSSTGPHGIGAGAGVPAARVTRMIGTIKAYATRVGAGPFVSELTDEIGDRIRRQGNEFGTTTGRPRRCGWFDAVAGRHAVRVSGATEVAMMHLDTLTGFERIGVCTSYRAGGRRFDVMPAELHRLRDAAPVLEYLPGWGENLRDVRHEEDLPDAAKRYIEFMERRLGVPVSMIGVGPEREQTLLRGR